MVADSPGADSDADSDYAQEGVELRAEVIVKDTMAVYAFAGMESIAPDDRARLAGFPNASVAPLR